MDELAVMEGHTRKPRIHKESTMKSFKHTLLVIISGGLTVGLLGMAYAAPAGSMAAEISITQNEAKDVMDTGGIGVEMGGVFKKVVGGSARQGVG